MTWQTAPSSLPSRRRAPDAHNARARAAPRLSPAMTSLPSSSFETHAPVEGFRLKGKEKLVFVTELFDRIGRGRALFAHG